MEMYGVEYLQYFWGFTCPRTQVRRDVAIGDLLFVDKDRGLDPPFERCFSMVGHIGHGDITQGIRYVRHMNLLNTS